MFFDFASARLSADNRAVLDKIAREYGGALISVVGHGDAPGSEFENLVISRKRAEAVTGYLEARGARRILGTAGHAQIDLEVADHGPNRRNRRVEVYISPCTLGGFSGS
jgi:outer membrane protein OmpA-like peptidoglycan-associated protein